MTNKEALAAKLLVPVPDNALEVALTDRAVNSATTYSSGQQEGVELALMDLLFSIFTNPDQVEGGYQVSHPDFFRKIKERLLQLAIKYEDENILAQIQDAVPTITSKAVW
jgi:hypothetical protein